VIEPKLLYDTFDAQGLSFYAGVPDSLLKDFCAYVTDTAPAVNHIIAANEGAAVALAAGYHLATGKAGIVYMQNSGIGNAINPILSLADREVYSIPMLLLIGWRAEPGVKDEPQHLKQGRVQLELLKALDIPYIILDADPETAGKNIADLCSTMLDRSSPVAVVVRKGTFSPYSLTKKTVNRHQLSREDALKIIVDTVQDNDIIVSTTGKTSRELFEYRERRGHGHEKDFLTVGSMGHASQIALGIALNRPDRSVYCIDGDGAVLMHMGSLAIIGAAAPRNYYHIVINNGAHESVGGQPTAGFTIDLKSVAQGCGYVSTFAEDTPDGIKNALQSMIASAGPSLLEIRVNLHARKDLGRPTSTPVENKKSLMKFIAR
jgi:phosphonopyruvate decarboxylase